MKRDVTREREIEREGDREAGVGEREGSIKNTWQLYNDIAAATKKVT